MLNEIQQKNWDKAKLDMLDGLKEAQMEYAEHIRKNGLPPGSIQAWRPVELGEGPTHTTLVDKNGTSYSFVIETDGHGGYRTRDSEKWAALWAAGARPPQSPATPG